MAFPDELEKLLRSAGTGPFNPNPRQLVQVAAVAGHFHGILLDRYLEISKTVKENKPRFRNKKRAREYLQELVARLEAVIPISEPDTRILYEVVELVTSDEDASAIADRIDAHLQSMKANDSSSLVAWAIVGIAADSVRRKGNGPNGEIAVRAVWGHDIAGGIMGALHGAAGGPAMALAIGTH